MNRAGFKKLLMVGVAILGLGLCAMPASAWWGGCYGGCYHGCGYGCGWGGYGYGWGGCGYGCGWGGYGYAWGGCGWAGCAYGCASSCCGTSIAYSGYGCSTCGGGQFLSQPAGTPSMPPTPPPTPPSGSTPGAAQPNRTSLELPDGESAVLSVVVPSDAKLSINGTLTRSTGRERSYVSYGLLAGRTYQYTVKVEIVRDGKILPQEQTVSLTAGARRSMAFDFNTSSNERLARTE